MLAAQINQYGPASDIKVVEVEAPHIQDDQILVKIGAAGVNPVDTYIRSGTNNYTANFPHTPGSDGAGTIAAIGIEVEGFNLNDRVYFNRCLTGSSAEYAICSPANLFPLADTLSFVEGACLGIPYTTAYRALFDRANAQAGDKVLIHGGTGAVGIAAVQLALASGMEVIASTGTEAGAKLLKQQGVQQVIYHKEENHLAPFQSLDTGFDVIIEMLANQNLDQDLKALGRNGCVAVVGNRGTIEINPRDLMARDASVVGVALANASPDDLKRISQALYPLFQQGLLKPVVRKTYSLTEVGLAHDAVLEPGALGNLVIDIASDA